MPSWMRKLPWLCMKLKYKGISHRQNVANSSKAEPIESFREKPLLLKWCWILYSKQLSWISMHKMHSQKKLRYLVEILVNARMYFANSHF